MMKIYPVSTEKVIRMLESENKLAFVVEGKFTKQHIKELLEKRFNAKIVSINKLMDRQSGNTRIYVKFSQDSPAIDIATKLGLM
ncbi:50S ribosomal protein L23 [Candidatus Woesearchaeota archaeon]|nr:50S ribosomal protein L23 [Candidatus Woesearchaeota archaeon]